MPLNHVRRNSDGGPLVSPRVSYEISASVPPTHFDFEVDAKITAVQWDQRGDSLAMKNLSKLAALETKRLRPLILAGDMHLLTDINMSSSMWAGWQYHDAQARAGAVQLFRREGCVASTFTAALQNLEPGRLWDVSVYGGDGYAHTKTVTTTTAELAALRVNVARAPGSAVVFYNQTETV